VIATRAGTSQWLYRIIPSRTEMSLDPTEEERRGRPRTSTTSSSWSGAAS
jgi:hypothetical protein